MPRINTPEEFRKYVSRACDEARVTILKFSESVVLSPGYELEWSGKVFEAAATLDVLAGFEHFFARLDEEDVMASRISPEEMLTNVRTSIAGQVVTGARYAPNTSTSATANLMTTYRLQAKARLAEALGCGEF